jgi:hypothetical protein
MLGKTFKELTGQVRTTQLLELADPAGDPRSAHGVV